MLSFQVVVLAVCGLASLCLCSVETVDHGAAAHKSAHFKGGVHNPVFDQEALIGSRDIDELAELPDDVRIRRLRILAKSHDKNNNDMIEREELKEWVIHSFRMLDAEESHEKMKDEDENKDGKVTFAEILHKNYGYTEEELKEIEIREKEENNKEFVMADGQIVERVSALKHITDDKNRFEAADVNKDGFLDGEEYMAYFQPYDYPHMYAVEMERTMRDMDHNSDGSVSLEEFIGEGMDEEARLSETTNFEELDKDNDGKLTTEELRPFALPDNSEVADEEVEHLVETCDANKDLELSIDEIVAKEDEFVSSAATDYGRNLHFVRDEL